MRPDFDNISTEEAYSKTMGSLDNNGYLGKESVYGAVYAVVECCKDQGCTEEQTRAHVAKALAKVYGP